MCNIIIIMSAGPKYPSQPVSPGWPRRRRATCVTATTSRLTPRAHLRPYIYINASNNMINY